MDRPRTLTRPPLSAAGCPTWVNLPTHQGHVPLHQHDFVEIALVRSGRAVHRTLHGLQPMARGDAIIIMPGHWHCYEGCRDLELANCLFSADLLQHRLAWLTADVQVAGLFGRDAGISTLHLDVHGLAHALDHVEALHRLVHGPAPLRSSLAQIGSLLLLVGELAQHVAPVAGDGGVLAHRAVASAIDLMNADLAHDWSLPELARRVGLNRSYLVRLFHRRCGASPIRWLARRRCEEAAVRLLTTDLPVATIGRTVGWPDANYFARRFRAVFRQTPSAYRRQLPVPAVVADAADAWIQW